jgi:hypothetical protein
VPEEILEQIASAIGAERTHFIVLPEPS